MLRWIAKALPPEWRTSIVGDLREEYARTGGPEGWRRSAWMAGHLVSVAVRLALARAGERVRGRSLATPAGWLRDAAADARHGIRRWLARPAFAAGAVATLAVGIGASSALFSVVDGILLKPLPYPHADRLVVVNRTYPDWRSDPILSASWDRISLTWPESFRLRERSRTLEALGVQTTRVNVLRDGTATELRVACASASFLSLLGVRPQLGVLFTAADDLKDSRTVLISHALWTQRFGADPSIVGRSIELDDGGRVVIGVLPSDLRWGGTASVRPYDVWLPLSAIPEPERTDNNRNLDAVALLAPGASVSAATDEMTALLREGFRFNSTTAALVTPLVERQVGSVRAPLMLLLAGAVLLLVIACANVAGLLAGDATGRSSEMAVRAALGAGRGRLLRQLCAEALLLAAAGAAGGLLVARWALRMFVAVAPVTLPRLGEVAIDWRVAAFAGATGLGTAMLFAIVPALGAVGRRGTAVVRGAGRSVTARQRVAAAMAIAEITLGVVLLVGAGLLLRSLQALQRLDPGFDTRDLLTMRVWLPASRYPDPERTRRFLDDAVDRLAALPGVVDAAVTSGLPFASGRASTTITLPGADGSARKVEAQRRYVSAGYFDAMRIRTLQGRTFTGRDGPDGPAVAVVSRSMAARFWPEGAVGRRFTQLSRPYEVVGVVNDVRDLSLADDPQATFYLTTSQFAPWSVMRLVVRTEGEASSLAASARSAIAGIDETVPVEDVSPMEELVYRASGDERYRAVLMTGFAAIAALLSAVGLYGTLARRVADRRREVGVRIALGARPAQVRRQFFGEGLRLAIAGLVPGVLGAVALARFARSLLFGVTPADPVTLAAVVCGVGVVTLLATLVPAHRASRLDPVVALRE